MSPRLHLAGHLILVLLVPECAELGAQAAPLKWSAGIDVQISGRPLPASSLGANLSRVLVGGRVVELRVEGSVFTARTQNDIVCVDVNGRCDTRSVSLYGDLSGKLVLGDLGRSVSAWPFLHAEAGACFTRWGEGSFTPSSGAPSEPARGSGPSGVVVSGGLGWRLGAAKHPLVAQLSMRRYQRAGPYGEDAVAFAASLGITW